MLLVLYSLTVWTTLSNIMYSTKKMPGYALQHKYGKEYQFHITKNTHKHHHKHYYVNDLTYEELYDLLSKE